MTTIKDVVFRLFPEGTNPLPTSGTGGQPHAPNHQIVPGWPPDVFALGATLLNLSGCYSHPRYVGWIENFFAEEGYSNEVIEVAGRWSEGEEVPEVQNYWERVIAASGERVHLPLNEDVDDVDREIPDWWGSVVMLTFIADEASRGIGFGAAYGSEDGPGTEGAEAHAGQPCQARPVALFFLAQHEAFIRGDTDQLRLKHIPTSLCQMVPPEEVCVQPKTKTAIPGCTIRSFTHHLALLPSRGEVETRWVFRFTEDSFDKRPLNLLLVPFPYHMDAECLIAGPALPVAAGDPSSPHPNRRRHFFDLKQRWLLRRDGTELSSDEFGNFLLGLMQEAKRKDPEVTEIHGIVLPELALNKRLADEVCQFLAERAGSELEFFISGVASGNGAGVKNSIHSSFFKREEPPAPWEQSKHHRWMLEKIQIERYGLQRQLDVDHTWWEQIDISPRRCAFYVFRHGACMVPLICEDLARIDPVQTVIRSIGPNLLIALLMDGPQVKTRWPANYATVLADDPGCSVLTLSSLALMRRSRRPGTQIALWKQANSEANELSVGWGDHALLLGLNSQWETSYTLDGRSDGGWTMNLTFAKSYAIKHPDAPVWID
jgi:hypothetical protein